jgi:hypothetical protein
MVLERIDNDTLKRRLTAIKNIHPKLTAEERRSLMAYVGMSEPTLLKYLNGKGGNYGKAISLMLGGELVIKSRTK